jgi:hypothetical protein
MIFPSFAFFFVSWRLGGEKIFFIRRIYRRIKEDSPRRRQEESKSFAAGGD